MRFMLHELGYSRVPAALLGLVPPLRTLHIGVKHVDNASILSAALADSILFGSPILSALLAAFLANTLTPPILPCTRH